MKTADVLVYSITEACAFRPSSSALKCIRFFPDLKSIILYRFQIAYTTQLRNMFSLINWLKGSTYIQLSDCTIFNNFLWQIFRVLHFKMKRGLSIIYIIFIFQLKKIIHKKRKFTRGNSLTLQSSTSLSPFVRFIIRSYFIFLLRFIIFIQIKIKQYFIKRTSIYQ